uniref:Uncharacterized protein n=1 Tax=Physcomitrium patens TaxID=3218 RepID=A0A7I4F143_PHYPA
MTRSFFREARLCIVWGGGGSLDLSSPMCFKHSVASKVGPDFLYCSKISHPPKVIADQKTTEFFADFTQEEERILKAGNICAPIESMDIPEMDYELGLVVGIAGGVLLETLQHIVDVARYVVVDVQVNFLSILPFVKISGTHKDHRFRNWPDWASKFGGYYFL